METDNEVVVQTGFMTTKGTCLLGVMVAGFAYLVMAMWMLHVTDHWSELGVECAIVGQGPVPEMDED